MTEPEFPQQPPIAQPWSDDEMGPPPPRSRSQALLFVGLGVIVTLIAGLVVWVAWPTPVRDRTPFEQAVAALASARGLRYSDTTTAGLGKRDITTTEYGHQFGTFDWMGDQREVLTVDGVFYAKATSKPSGTQPALPHEGKWRTGDASDHSVFGEPLAEFGSPIELAERLSTALDELPDLPSPDDADLPAYTANGVEALRAETSAGSLFVAKHAPYRVLRLEPHGLLNLPPSQLISMTALPPRADPVVSDSKGVDLTPIVEAALVNRMYDTLAEKTKQLADAMDGSFRFDVANKTGDVECGLAGCTATASFTGKLDPRTPNVRVAAGQVTVTMNVAFTVNGRNAGTCTSPPASFPVTGNTVSAQMSCSAPQGGAIIADLKARAEAQSRATGRPVPYNWVGRSQVEVTALASARTEIDELLNRQQEERKSSACKAPNSFVPGTRVLLADGTTRPIEFVTPGAIVRATDPATGRTTAEPVLALITGTGRKQLSRLTVSDGQRAATVTATGEHPFYDPELRRWVPARDLHPGQALAGLSGSNRVRVVANDAHQEPLTVYNLTVANAHTYYVLAGTTPVLVHNQDEEPCKPNWNPKSRPTFGHTFSVHGAGDKITKNLVGRAASTGKSQGQWLDNQAAAEFLRDNHIAGAGTRTIPIPAGMGQVIMPNGTIVPATSARVVPGPNGFYRSAFPIN